MTQVLVPRREIFRQSTDWTQQNECFSTILLQQHAMMKEKAVVKFKMKSIEKDVLSYVLGFAEI
jgi:hypothetical protein